MIINMLKGTGKYIHISRVTNKAVSSMIQFTRAKYEICIMTVFTFVVSATISASFTPKFA